MRTFVVVLFLGLLAVYECAPSATHAKRQLLERVDTNREVIRQGPWGGRTVTDVNVDKEVIERGGRLIEKVDTNREVIRQNPWGGETVTDVKVDREFVGPHWG
ncbi:hypothetical protein AAVH_25035 [Aphelenchoides avenae]|nr:hypothetical protein AAVH_25035 [Aphelenchus avenae]